MSLCAESDIRAAPLSGEKQHSPLATAARGLLCVMLAKRAPAADWSNVQALGVSAGP